MKARSALGALALWAILSPAAAFASWTLDFGVGGYCVQMEVGDDAGPELARVRFFPPGDTTGIPLRPQDIRVKAFDPVQRQLQLEHRAATSGAPGFELTVDGDRGTLDVEGAKLQAPFDWQM